jgi:hypothetical protein
MMTCQIESEGTAIASKNGISLIDCQHSPEAKEFQESIDNLTYQESNGGNTIIPFRFLEKLTLKTTIYLGALIQSNFRCSKTGDEFQVTLAFGYCRNDLNMGDFKNILDNLENARVEQNAELQEIKKVIKTEGGKAVTNYKLLDEMNESKEEAIAKTEELTKWNEELTVEILAKDEVMESEETLAISLEESCENCHGAIKMLRGNMSTLENEMHSLEMQISALNNQVKSNVAADITKVYDETVVTLNKLFTDIKMFNPLMTLPSAQKQTRYDHQNLAVLY